ncbi:MAG: ABC transporter ATP-binding protein [Myxococcales bacterium]|nr:ABC transporter ATP-binding protein [Myxococcales bacterium]
MQPFRYFPSQYPKETALTVGYLILSAAAEGLGLATAVPLLALAMQEDQVTVGSGSEAIDRVSAALNSIGLPFELWSLALVIGILIWVKAGLVILAWRHVGNAVARISTRLRLELLSALFRARWSYFQEYSLGRLSTALSVEATRTANAFRDFALATQSVFLSIVGVCVALVISWKIALLSLVGGAMTIAILHFLVRMAGKAGRKQSKVINDLLSRFSDVVPNVKLLKMMRREHLVGPLLEADTQRLKRAMRKEVLAHESLKGLQEPLTFVLLLVCLVYARNSGMLEFSEVSVMLLALARGLSKAQKVQACYQRTATAQPFLEAIVKLTEATKAAAEELHGGRAPTFERAIEIRGLSFAYHEKQVLDNVDLEFSAGEITALVGSSGSGKTTIIDLIAGLIQPSAGSVLIDGEPLDEIDLAAWRSSIGAVPQEVLLFNDTIRANVTMGDTNISDEDVIAALKAAGVWDEISEQRGGLDLLVGERGALLSGGQRTRIGIARALASRPKLLILDEATASLDPESERLLWDTIEGLRGSVTVIAISHQPALKRIADRVYRIRDGRAELESGEAEEAHAG